MSDRITNPTSPERSAMMRSVKREGTELERRVWQIANKMGLVYEVNSKDLPGSPDLVNQADRWAVFVHGCFWHAGHK